MNPVEVPDIKVPDIEVPEKNDIEVLATLRSQTRSIQGVLNSRYLNSGDLNTHTKQGPLRRLLG